MKIIVKWLEDKKTPISACAIDPVFDKIIIGVGKLIYYFSLKDKERSDQIKCDKHTSDVTCLGFRKDGLFFASGSKDCIVYIWSTIALAKPINKISNFTDSILQINYNPCIMSVSCIVN